MCKRVALHAASMGCPATDRCADNNVPLRCLCAQERVLLTQFFSPLPNLFFHQNNEANMLHCLFCMYAFACMSEGASVPPAVRVSLRRQRCAFRQRRDVFAVGPFMMERLRLQSCDRREKATMPETFRREWLI